MAKNRNKKSTTGTPERKMFSASYSGYQDNSGKYEYTDRLNEIKYLGDKYRVAQYGSSNNQPELWDELEAGGGWHAACLRTKYKFSAGRGLRILSSAGMEAEVPVVNTMFQTLYDLNEMNSQDHIKYGGHAVEVIWSQDGTTITSLRHIPWRFIRAEAMNEFGDVLYYWRSQSWRGGSNYQYYNGETKERIAVFNPARAVIDRKQILIVRRPNDQSAYYPKPDSSAVVKSAQLESEIKTAKLSFAMRAANPAYFLLIPFDANKNTEDDFQDIVDTIDDTQVGANQTGRTGVLSYTPGADNTPTMIAPPKMENQNAYEEWTEDNTFEIFSHHGILFPEIVGRPNQNTGLGTEDIEAKFTIFVNTALAETQRYTLRSMMMVLPYLEGFDDTYEVEIVQLDPTDGIEAPETDAPETEEAQNEETNMENQI